jgi:hypothetical protein
LPPIRMPETISTMTGSSGSPSATCVGRIKCAGRCFIIAVVRRHARRSLRADARGAGADGP